MIKNKKKWKVLNWFLGSEEQEELRNPKDIVIEFTLKYKNLIIGFLVIDNGEWTFEYSEEFKNQKKIDPLADFPDLNKKYNSLHLWPFFLHRIPGLGQPQVQKIIEEENLQKSEVHLLKRFGQKSITNPFELSVSF